MRPAWALGLLALAALALAGEAFSLKRVDQAGTVRKYALRMKFDISGTEGDFTADLTQTTEEVTTDGVVKVKSEMQNGLVDLNGSQMARDLPTFVGHFAPNNLVTKVEGEAASSTLLRFARCVLPVFPAGPVEAADDKTSWTVDVPADSAQGVPAWQGQGSYLGKEQQEGEECLKLGFELKETEGDAAITTKGTAWLRADGSVVKVVANVTNMPVEGYLLNAEYTLISVRPS